MALADINCQHHGKLVSATLQESVPSLVSLQMDGSSIGSARNSHFWSPSWFSQPSYSLLSSRRMLVSSQQVKCYVACLGECSLLLHRHMHLKFFHSRCECISHLIPTCKFLILGRGSVLTLSRCFIIGQLIAAGVLEGLVSLPTQWSYRIPFALQVSAPSLFSPRAAARSLINCLPTNAIQHHCAR